MMAVCAQQDWANTDSVMVAVRELCRTSEALQETFAVVHRYEDEMRSLQESVARLNASNQELRAQIETKDRDLFVAQGERDVLRLLMTSSLSGCLPEPSAPCPKKEQAATLHAGFGDTGTGEYSP